MRTYQTLDEALVSELSNALTHESRVSPRGRSTVETTDCIFRLLNPRARLVSNRARRWSASYAFGELLWHLAGSDDLGAISYYSERWKEFADKSGIVQGSCYGRRIFGVSGDQESQWDRVKRLLEKDPASRRAIISINESHGELGEENNDVACCCVLQFLIRDEKLNLIAYFRSNDLFLGFGYDVFVLTMLQELMALMLGRPLGWYQHVVGSAHVYEDDFSRAGFVVKAKVEGPAALPMEAMSRPEDIGRVLEYERLLRAAEHVGAEIPFDVGHYWEDVLLVLLVKRLRRDGRTEAAWAARSRLRSEGIRGVVDMSFEGRIETAGKGNHGVFTWHDGSVAGDHLR